MNFMSPEKWFEDFYFNLRNTKCRTQLKDCSFEDGLRGLQLLLRQVRQQNGTVYWVGNGGSNAICSHLSQDVLNKLSIKSFALNDPALMTCMSNDFGYEKVFVRPLKTFMDSNDMLIAISSSGNSENILNAVDIATQAGGKIVTLSSFLPDNKLYGISSDVAFYLPANLYGHAEVGHEAIIHAAVETMFLQENQ